MVKSPVKKAIEEGEERAAPQLTSRDVFKVLFRRKWIVLILFLSTTALVLWNASRVPIEYSSTAKVLLNRGMRNSALDRNVSLLTWDETVNSELQIASSQPVVEKAQDILDRQAEEEGTEPITIEARGVNSVLLGESNVIGIQYRSNVEAEVIPVANALASGYIEVHDVLFALPDVQEYFDTQVVEAERRLEDLTDRKQRIQEEGAIIRINTQQDQLLSSKNLLTQDLAKVQKEYAAQKAEVEEVRNLLYQGDVDVPFETRRFEDNAGMISTLYSMKRSLLDLRVQRADLLAKYTDRHPGVIALDQRISDLREEMRDEAEQLLKVKEHALRVSEAEMASIRSDIAHIEEQVLAFPRIERELSNLSRSIDLAAATYQKLLESQVQIGVATVSSRDFTLSMLSGAGPAVATDPRDPVRLALVPAFSLLIGLTLAFFVETMDHSLKGREDVEKHLDLPVLASIPNRKKMTRN